MKHLIAALFATALVASLATTAPAKTEGPKASYLTRYCCDIYGVRRCVMPVYVEDGTPCYCNYQGDGFAC